MAQLALAEKVKTHWAGLLEPLQSLKGLGVFTPGAREIQTWLLELDAPLWPIPGGQVRQFSSDSSQGFPVQMGILSIQPDPDLSLIFAQRHPFPNGNFHFPWDTSLLP